VGKKILRFLWENFLAGILLILPVFLTVIIIRFLVINVNSIMLEPILSRLKSSILEEEQRLFLARTLVFLSVTGLIILAGLMTRVLIIRRTFSFFEGVLFKFPIVNKIYGTTKEISHAFLGTKKSSFQKVVLIEYPRKGIYTIGFVTSMAGGKIQEATGRDDVLSIYVPTTPNPTSGLYVLLRREDVTPLAISVEEALKVVISAGVIAPENHKNAIGDTTQNNPKQ